MSKISIINPVTKQMHHINANRLQEALNDGMHLSSHQKKIAVRNPVTQKIHNIDTNRLKEALNDGLELQTEANFSDKVQAFAQGASGAIGGIGDFVVGGATKLASTLLPNVPTNTGNAGMEQAFSPIASIKQGLSDIGNKMWEEKPLEHLQRQGVGAIAGAIGGEKARNYITEDTGLEHLKGVKIARTAGEFAGMALMPTGLIEKGLANTTNFAKAEQAIQKAGELATTTEASNFIKSGVMVENASGQLIKPRFAQQADKLLKTFVTDAIVGGTFEAVKSDEPDANLMQTTVLPIFASIIVGSAIPMASSKAVENITKYVSDISKGTTSTERKLIKEFASKIDINKAEELKKSGLPVSVDLMTDDGQIKALVHNEIAKSKISSEIFDKAQQGINKDILKNISASSEHLGKPLQATAEQSKLSVATNKISNITSNRINELNNIADKYYEKIRGINYKFELPNISQHIDALLSKKKIDKEAFLELFKKDRKIAEDLIHGQGIHTPESMLEFRNILKNAFDRSDTGGKTKVLENLNSIIDKNIIELGKKSNDIKAKKISDLWLVARENFKNHKTVVLNTKLAKGIVDSKLPEDLIKYFADPSKPSKLNELDIVFKTINSTAKSNKYADTIKKCIFEVYVEKNIVNVLDKNILEKNKLTNIYNSLRNDKTYLIKLLGTDKYNKLEQEVIPYLGSKIQSASINKNPSGSALVAMSEDKLTSNFAKYGAGAGGFLGAQAGGTIGAGIGSVAGATVGKAIDKLIINKKIRETKEIAGLLFDTGFNEKLIKASKDIQSKQKLSFKNTINQTAKRNISPFAKHIGTNKD